MYMPVYCATIANATCDAYYSTSSRSCKPSLMTETIDLVGGQFAVIESDPGVFTTLTHKLGMKTLSFVEVYDTASHAMDHLNPRGLIFCYLWQKESPEPANQSSEIDEDAENVWFANQLIDDGCATQAILNIVLNCEGVQIGETLEQFKAHTDKMSPAVSLTTLVVSSSLIWPDERLSNFQLTRYTGSTQFACEVRTRRLCFLE